MLTFYLSNRLPHAVEFNHGIWSLKESQVKSTLPSPWIQEDGVPQFAIALEPKSTIMGHHPRVGKPFTIPVAPKRLLKIA